MCQIIEEEDDGGLALGLNQGQGSLQAPCVAFRHEAITDRYYDLELADRLMVAIIPD